MHVIVSAIKFDKKLPILASLSLSIEKSLGKQRLGGDWRLGEEEIRVVFSICIIYLSFLKSETSLNFSNFDRQDFVNVQNFGYGVIMT